MVMPKNKLPERVEPLMERLRQLDAVMTWEGYASLDLDDPRQKDIILQHWYVTDDRGTRYYIVRIYADGAGWDVFKPVDDSNNVQGTLDAIF